MKIKIKKTLDFWDKRVLQLYCKIKKGDENMELSYQLNNSLNICNNRPLFSSVFSAYTDILYRQCHKKGDNS